MDKNQLDASDICVFEYLIDENSSTPPRGKITHCRFTHKFPRFSCSISMASNNDLKFPAPNPCKNNSLHHQEYAINFDCAVATATPHLIVLSNNDKTHLMIISLNDFEENSWTILHIFREYLQQIPIVIIIDKNL